MHDRHIHHGHSEHMGHDPNVFQKKFWLCLALTIPTLVFSHAVQSWFGVTISFTGSHYISALFGLVIFTYGGTVFLKAALNELCHRRPGMMTLIAMAISVAFLYSLFVTLGVVRGMDFWWELATLVTIMLLGHWIEMASVTRAQGALQELAKLLPSTIEVIDDTRSIREMPLEHAAIGMNILVRPGAQIPVDGEIVAGSSDVNESLVTGESRPLYKKQGDQVIGGTLSTNGSLTVRVTKLGSSTVLGSIMRLVANAETSRTRTQEIADIAAFWLTIAAIVIALLTWLAWWYAGGSASFILERVVTVLVVACPHALGLAVPLVTAIATSLATKNGLLIRQRQALESSRKLDVVLFDKTGTLTTGEQTVASVVSDSVERTLELAASLEYTSEHPIAKAIVAYAETNQVTRMKPDTFTSYAGIGVIGRIGTSQVGVGGRRMIEKLDAQIDTSIASTVEMASREGKTAIYVIDNTVVIGAILVADTIREESKDAVRNLQQHGIRVAVVSGDSTDAVRSVAASLGIDEYFAEVLPENKVDIVKKLQEDNKQVAMVGDGVNDAPALVRADIGIAIGAGTDVAIESADIVLVGSNPADISKILTLSQKTYRKMSQNLAWAIGYNALAIPLATGVASSIGFVLSPAVGALLMSASTVIVAVNAQMLRNTKL